MSELRSLLARSRQTREEIQALTSQLSLARGALPLTEHCRRVLEERKRVAEEDLSRLEQIIQRVDDARGRTLLRYYYIMGWSDARIGEELGITNEWARKKRYATVRRLERQGSGEKGVGGSR